MREIERGWKVLGVRTGHLSIDEWAGYWRASESDTPPAGEEYRTVYNALSDYLEESLRLGCSPVSADCYVRGDNEGHRTQFLEILRKEIVTVELIEKLQTFLRRGKHWSWRIVVMTYLGHDEIPVVYPDVVRLGRRFDGMSLADALADIRSRMEPV